MSFINKRFPMRLHKQNGRRAPDFPRDSTYGPMRITRLTPLALKNSVSGGGSDETDIVCISEMMSLFECFSKNEFETSPCKDHVDKLQSCYSNHVTRRKLKNTPDTSADHDFGQGNREVTRDHLNRLFNMYPLSKPLK